MNKINIICLTIAATSLIIAAIIAITARYKTVDIMRRLSAMLESAMGGSFNESVYDESVLSAVESKMNRYLSQCAVSNKNLIVEKNKIETLISDISHQTKTPIANILLYSQLLCEHELPEDCTTCVNALSSQAEKLNFLIGALVKTSRLETGIISVIPQKNKVQDILQTVEQQIKPKADAKKIVVTVINAEVFALFDIKWTTEAIYNIVDNAVKYTGDGGFINITTTPYELFCRIDITDNGIGVSEDEQNKIFGRFYRSIAVNTQEGVGIGLFLAREIIAAEGGYIKVQSKIGKGSTFSIFLPHAN